MWSVFGARQHPGLATLPVTGTDRIERCLAAKGETIPRSQRVQCGASEQFSANEIRSQITKLGRVVKAWKACRNGANFMGFDGTQLGLLEEHAAAEVFPSGIRAYRSTVRDPSKLRSFTVTAAYDCIGIGVDISPP